MNKMKNYSELFSNIRIEKGYNKIIKDYDYFFDDISFKYNSNVVVFENASFKLECGKSTALIGVNGSGKTTILKILSGFEKSNGNMHSNEHIIGYSSAEGLDMNPFLTCKKLISLCLEELNNKYLLNVLETLQLKNVYGTRIISLSSGQRKKLSIFKAFVTGKDIIFLDEPTAHLDIEAIDQVSDTINCLKNTVPIIFISHSKELIKKCADNIYKVKGLTVVNGDGKIELIKNLN